MTRPPRKPRRPGVAKTGLLLLACGVLTLSCPPIAKLASSRAQNRDLAAYREVVPATASAQFHRAVHANSERDYSGAVDALRVPGSDVIATVSLPALGVCVPVYPSSTPSDLQRGAGHLEETAAPVGGLGTHAAITAHSGMITAAMFDALPELEVGDFVEVEALHRSLRYQVFFSQVVTPEDGWRALRPRPGEDLLTLVTCTPRGVNTHRLLVTARRVQGAAVKAPALRGESALGWGCWLTLMVGAAGSLGVSVRRVARKGRQVDSGGHG